LRAKQKKKNLINWKHTKSSISDDTTFHSSQPVFKVT